MSEERHRIAWEIAGYLDVTVDAGQALLAVDLGSPYGIDALMERLRASGGLEPTALPSEVITVVLADELDSELLASWSDELRSLDRRWEVAHR